MANAAKLCKFSVQSLIFLTLSLTLVSCGKWMDPSDANEGSVGAAARNLLSSNSFDSLSVEIQPINGANLDANTISNLRRMIGLQLNKNTVNVQVNPSRTVLPKPAYTAEDLRQLETASRTKLSDLGKKEMSVFVLVLDAPSDDNPIALGRAYSATSMAVFEHPIEAAASADQSVSRASLWAVQSTVVNHLFSQLLGLGNGGTLPTSHHFASDRHHCSNPHCLMSVNLESSSNVMDFVKRNGGGVADLDGPCKADLRANGGKGI